jgi:cytoskeleton protein RodZ
MTNSRSKVSAKWIMAGIVVVAVGAVAYGLRQGVDFAGLTQSAGSQVKEGASQIITPSAPASQGDAAPSASDSAAAPEPVNAQPPVEPSAPSAGLPGEAASPQAAAPAVPPAPATQQGGAATSQAAGTPAATGAAVPAPAAAAVPQAAPANTGNTLVIKARQDSWIEIKAAGSARPVISRVVKAGETESLEVTDTVAVVVGNASGVDATLRGNPVDLKATGNGNVARITLK